MNIKKFNWTIWLEDEKECDKSFLFYLEKGLLKKEPEKENLSKSHIKKVDYNLDFINFLLEEKKYYDWIIIGCYYTLYHSTLALLGKKGYSSKNHLATLCALIKFYYSSENNKNLTKEDIELIERVSLKKEEIGYFADAKNKRETASYGISEEFEKEEAEELLKKVILFVNKTKSILEQII